MRPKRTIYFSPVYTNYVGFSFLLPVSTSIQRIPEVGHQDSQDVADWVNIQGLCEIKQIETQASIYKIPAHHC